jgi:hypothetical protein
MVVTGLALVVVAAVFGHLWGAVRIVFALAGVVLLMIGFLLAVGVTKLKVGASSDGGIEATAEIPKGYTKTMRVSDTLTEGSSPPKTGTMPPKVGIMPPKQGTMPPKDAEQR